MLLELTKLDDMLLFVNVTEIESFEEVPDPDFIYITVITTKTDNTYYVQERVTDIAVEYKVLMEKMREDSTQQIY
jgi:uncharacterized protein YlzI (FlbEa/FlbD family)